MCDTVIQNIGGCDGNVPDETRVDSFLHLLGTIELENTSATIYPIQIKGCQR